jgi:hypothetical protein
MSEKLYKEAVMYVKNNLPYYIKLDKTLKDALRYYLNGKTEITEQSIVKWIKDSYSQKEKK